MTRQTAKEYVRVRVKDLKDESIVDTFLNTELNLSRRKVQKDLMSMNLKRFDKVVFNSGPIFDIPSDLMEAPNSIIDMKASTGARASVTTNFTGANNDITLTWNEPGTGGNITDVIVFSDGLASGVTITPVFSAAGIPSFTIMFAPGATASSLITAINADTTMSLYVTAANKSGDSGAGTITLGLSVAHTTTGGTGTGWAAADETSMDNLSRMTGISLLAPSATFPKFAVKGVVDGGASIEFEPKTVTFSKMNYKYWLADLTAESDDLGIYKSGEELVLMDMIQKAFGLLKEQTEVDKMKIEYETAMNMYKKSYQDSLGALVQEKQRMETADKAN